MLMLAMKSAGPKMTVSTRGDAAAMSSTAMRPRAFSICASIPIRPTSSPTVRSTWVTSRSSATTWSALWTLGSMRQSRLAPAPSTTSTTSRYVHSVVQSLTRTTRIRSPHPPSLRAATIVPRAAGFASGATASSRSRNTWSAGSVRALSIIFGLLPGTARQDRRGRRARATGSDMAADSTDLVRRWLGRSLRRGAARPYDEGDADEQEHGRGEDTGRRELPEPDRRDDGGAWHLEQDGERHDRRRRRLQHDVEDRVAEQLRPHRHRE